MIENTKPPVVTRGELYPILGSVYLLIAFALLGSARSAEQSTLILIGHALLFMVAVGMSITFTVWGLRERQRGRSARRNPDEPSAAANQPSQ